MRRTSNSSGESVLDHLEFMKIRCRCAIEYRIGIVKSGLNESCCKTKADVVRERGSDMAESTEVVKRRFAQVTDMLLQTEGLVEVDA